MSSVSITLQGREAAEAQMLDACRIERAGSATTIDPDTGLPTTGAAILVYEGPCKVKSESLQEDSPDSGGHIYTVESYYLHIPIGAGPVAINDVATITAAGLDAQNVGRKFRIATRFNKTFATAQRLSVEEVTA